MRELCPHWDDGASRSHHGLGQAAEQVLCPLRSEKWRRTSHVIDANHSSGATSARPLAPDSQRMRLSVSLMANVMDLKETAIREPLV